MITLHHGDCLDILPTLEAGSVDCVITDPPYPMIKRDYGTMTEAEWMSMMQSLIPEIRRVLKPTGSAVFILQPNFDTVGRMRLWLWDFLSWVGREWNIVQDAYWWNFCALPTVGATHAGLMRSSVKMCVWIGGKDCYRQQSAVLWRESDGNKQHRLTDRIRNEREERPSGHGMINGRIRGASIRRGGVTPFNLLPMPHDGGSGAGAHGHGAGTPFALADWWTRYICPPKGTVLDCFMGSGTMGLAAINNECGFIGIEKMPKYFDLAQKRIHEAENAPRTMRMELTA